MSNKPTKTASKPAVAPSVADAERTIADLQQKRRELVERRSQLDETRRIASYRAHVHHDAEARQRLDQVHAEAGKFESELRSIDDAISEAQARLQQAQSVEANAADRAAASQLRDVAVRLGERFHKADKLFAAAIDELNAVPADLIELHRLGSTFPMQIWLCAVGSGNCRHIGTETFSRRSRRASGGRSANFGPGWSSRSQPTSSNGSVTSKQTRARRRDGKGSHTFANR
jgi:hypothetical protein